LARCPFFFLTLYPPISLWNRCLGQKIPRIFIFLFFFLFPTFFKKLNPEMVRSTQKVHRTSDLGRHSPGRNPMPADTADQIADGIAAVKARIVADRADREDAHMEELEQARSASLVTAKTEKRKRKELMQREDTQLANAVAKSHAGGGGDGGGALGDSHSGTAAKGNAAVTRSYLEAALNATRVEVVAAACEAAPEPVSPTSASHPVTADDAVPPTGVEPEAGGPSPQRRRDGGRHISSLLEIKDQQQHEGLVGRRAAKAAQKREEEDTQAAIRASKREQSWTQLLKRREKRADAQRAGGRKT
jgi:hypothetical protein